MKYRFFWLELNLHKIYAEIRCEKSRNPLVDIFPFSLFFKSERAGYSFYNSQVKQKNQQNLGFFLVVSSYTPHFHSWQELLDLCFHSIYIKTTLSEKTLLGVKPFSTCSRKKHTIRRLRQIRIPVKYIPIFLLKTK